MIKNRKKDFTHNGVKVLRSNHRDIRRLKNIYKPALHGFRVWPSSWLLMDYFMRSRVEPNLRILEIGCGWGIAGISCVKNFNSVVTCVDSDSAVFPYVNLHAKINDVTVTTVQSDFDDLGGSFMKNTDIMIGSDICFWDDMVDIVKTLILRALKHGVKKIIIADPGRQTFERMGEYFLNDGRGKIINRDISLPYNIQGRILTVTA